MIILMMSFLFLLLFFFVNNFNFVNKKEWGELFRLLEIYSSIERISPHSFQSGYKGPNRILSLRLIKGFSQNNHIINN